MCDSQRATKLHVTFNDRELLGDLAIYQDLAKNMATVLHCLTSRSEAVTSEILHETHVTGLQALSETPQVSPPYYLSMVSPSRSALSVATHAA